jgi:hypothetical protein
MTPQEKVADLAASIQSAERALSRHRESMGGDTPITRRLERALKLAVERHRRAAAALPAEQPSLPGMGDEEGGGA